jgi:hypothetical protein
MKQASDIKQCQSLGALKNFPEPDLIIEYFWASDSHPYHLKSDEKFLAKDEGVDYIPAWSLGKMIEGLPADLLISEDLDEDEDGDTYELFLAPPSDVKLAEVAYKHCVEDKYLYKTEATELVDAIFKMIMKLNEQGYYNDI